MKKGRGLAKEKDVTVPSLRIFELLPKKPMITISAITKRLEITKPTAAKVVDVLLKCEILREYSGKKRDRVFAYSRYLDVLRDED